MASVQAFGRENPLIALTVTLLNRKDEDYEEEVSDESEYEVSDRSDKAAPSEDGAASSQDLGRERQREEAYSEEEEDEDDGVITRRHVRQLIPISTGVADTMDCLKDQNLYFGRAKSAYIFMSLSSVSRQ